MTDGRSARRLAAAMLIAAAVAAAVLTWPRGGGAGGGPEPAPRGEGDAPAETSEVPDPIEPAPYREPGAAPVPYPAEAGPAASRAGLLVSRRTPRSGRLHGVWSGGDGSPLAGERVRIHRIGADGRADAQMVAATGADGTYSAWLEPGAWRAAFNGEAYEVEMAPQGERRLDHRDPPETAATVRVRVEGPDVQAWNALVALAGEAADGPRQVLTKRTGADEVAEFERVRAGPLRISGQLQRTAGGRPVAVHAHADAPEEGVVEVVLRQPAGRLDVVVSDAATGAAVEGAVVEFREPGAVRAAASAVTGPGGRCRIDGVAPGPGTLLVKHPEYVPARALASIAGSGGSLDVRLSRGFSVPVEARGEDGTPMMIVLRGRVLAETPPREWEWRLDEGGRGTMDRLPFEDAAIELLAAGCEPLLVHAADLRAAGSHAAVFKRLPPPAK